MTQHELKLGIPVDGEIGEGEDIKNQGGLLMINPYTGPDMDLRKSGRHENTVFDVMVYLCQLDSLLDWRFVFRECFKFGVNYVGTDGGFMGWERSGRWATFGYADSKRQIDLNPHIDKKKVAGQIREAQGIDIEPEEVYYWIWFHEIGHIVHEEETIKFLARRRDNTLNRADSPADRKKLRALSEAVEKKADEYANQRFTEWKSSAQGQSSGFPRIARPESTNQ